MKTLLSTRSFETVWQIHKNLQAGEQINIRPEFIANQQGEGDAKAEFIQASAEPDCGFSVQIGTSGTRKIYPPRQIEFRHSRTKPPHRWRRCGSPPLMVLPHRETISESDGGSCHLN